MNKTIRLPTLFLAVILLAYGISSCTISPEEAADSLTTAPVTIFTTEEAVKATTAEETEEALPPPEETEPSPETEAFTGFAFDAEITDENATETRAPRIPDNPKMVLSPIELSLYIGDKAPISVFTNFDSEGFSWSSDNPEVCNVDESGNVEAKAKGTAVISCSAMCGEKESSCECVVTVIPKTITVKLDPCSGSVSKKTIKAKEGEPIGKLPQPQRSGYSFKGWYTSPQDGTKVTSKSTFTSDATIYAVWEEDEYPVITNYTYYSYN